MRRIRKLIPLTAAFLICLLGVLTLAGLPYFGILFMCLAILCFLGLTAGLMRKPRNEVDPHDPYDLKALRDVHERAEREKMHVKVPREEADIVCPHCGHLHGPQFFACPNCGRVP
jgi:uncharacterized membrane protein